MPLAERFLAQRFREQPVVTIVTVVTNPRFREHHGTLGVTIVLFHPGRVVTIRDGIVTPNAASGARIDIR